MTKDAMITVKVAASLLNLDERTVRERLSNGTLRGEKLSHGQREKWYVHTSAIESELKQKQRMESAADSLKKLQMDETEKAFAGASVVNQEESQLNFEPERETVDVEEVGESAQHWRSVQAEQLDLIAEKLLKPLSERLEMQALILAEKDRIIEEKDRQLRLLPDLQKQAESERQIAEIKVLESEALRKQISALEEKQAAALDKERKAAEESDLAWKQQITALKEKHALAVEQERRAAEHANAETERMRSEKEAQAKAVQEQLELLTKQIQELKVPWWKKVLGI